MFRKLMDEIVSLDAVAAYWCSALPPSSGLIDSIALILRSFMQEPHLEIRKEMIELFPTCPALSIPRRLLTPIGSKFLEYLEHDQTQFAMMTRTIHDYHLSRFVHDDDIIDAINVCEYIKAYFNCLLKGLSLDLYYQLSEICRAAIRISLLLEPKPNCPIDIPALEQEIQERQLVEIEQPARHGTNISGNTSSIPRRGTFHAPFLSRIPRPIISTRKSNDWNPFEYSEALKRRLKEAQRIEKRYNQLMEIRQFLYLFFDKLANETGE